MSDAAGSLIEADGLAVGYDPAQPLLRGIRLSVLPGQVVTLIGPNGTGKSTILKTVAGYLPPLAGAIRLSGRDGGALSPAERARLLAVLLTDRPRTELVSCQDVVETGRYPHTGRLGILSARDRDAVREAMRATRTWNLRDHDFMRISDGQRQRVMLARALCQEAPALVLDEPTSHLDIHYQIELVTLLRDIARERGLAVLMALHELPLARVASDWLICVKDDGLVTEGAPGDIFVPEVIDALFDLEAHTFDASTGEIRLPANALPGGDGKHA